MKYNLSMRESQALHLIAQEVLPTRQAGTSCEIAEHLHISQLHSRRPQKVLIEKITCL